MSDRNFDMLNILEVADRLSVSVSTVRRLIDSGRLRASKIGKQVRICKPWADELVASNATNNINTGGKHE